MNEGRTSHVGCWRAWSHTLGESKAEYPCQEDSQGGGHVRAIVAERFTKLCPCLARKVFVTEIQFLAFSVAWFQCCSEWREACFICSGSLILYIQLISQQRAFLWITRANASAAIYLQLCCSSSRIESKTLQQPGNGTLQRQNLGDWSICAILAFTE